MALISMKGALSAGDRSTMAPKNGSWLWQPDRTAAQNHLMRCGAQSGKLATVLNCGLSILLIKDLLARHYAESADHRMSP